MKGRIEIEHIRYFKNDWGIATASVIETTEGKFTTDSNKQITIKGNMPPIEVGRIYYITAKEIEDPKYGLQYEVSSLASELYVNDSDEASKRKYLQVLFSEKIVDSLYATLPDPFKALKERDYEALVQVKGCKINNAIKWSDKFESEYSLSRLYTELEEYDLSTSMLKLLLRSYGSPDIVIQKVKENPYLLTEVRGIGFAKADVIAQKAGIGEFDTRRIKAFIKHYLTQEGMEGNSYVPCDVLMNEMVNALGEELPDLAVADSIHEMSKELWWNEEKTQIGLASYRRLEQNIADELWRIKEAKPAVKVPDNRNERIAEIERRQGWGFTDQQKAALNAILDNNVTVINGAAGCVDCDTEFFTGYGWKRIADFEDGDSVLQYNEDGTAELVKPLAYIKQPCDYLYHFETKYGLSQTLSYNHNVAYLTSRGNLAVIPFHEVMRRHKRNTNGFGGKFLTTFKYSGKGMDLTDDEIRLMVAIFADGHFADYCKTEGNRTYKQVRMNVKKERKKQRLEYLLDRVQISYKKASKPTADGYHEYYFTAPYIGKHYTKDWYDCNEHQLRIIADEVMKWDGRYASNNDYTTTNKEDADFIQYVFTVLGYRSSITVNDRVGQPHMTCGKEYIRKSPEYMVRYTTRAVVGMSSHASKPKIKIQEVATKDGYEYCFTVPSGRLVLRNNNKIFITMNCGKSSISFGALELLSNCSSAICALSGKAAVRLGEASGRKGSTIHKLLSYSPADGFEYDKFNRLPHDIIVVDEISMIGGRLFYSLLQAIKDGAKLILLGDTGQLESIGECNVANDIIRSGAIPVVTLDKIHRQAQKSAIITESLKVRGGQQIITKDWAGVEARGEKKDLILDCYSDSANTYIRTLRHFDEAMAEVGNDISKVQILCPLKARGDACVWKFNQAIQSKYNPHTDKIDELEVYYPGRGQGCLRVGDKVINVKNNYNTVNIDGKKSPIFNGNIGTVLSIDNQSKAIIVDFIGFDAPVVIASDLSAIELAYAVTVHKYQGSAAEIVIFSVDFVSRVLLSKELIYTGITRASQKCIVVAQNSALRFAVAQTHVSTKNTHLKELLHLKAHPELLKMSF